MRRFIEINNNPFFPWCKIILANPKSQDGDGLYRRGISRSRKRPRCSARRTPNIRETVIVWGKKLTHSHLHRKKILNISVFTPSKLSSKDPMTRHPTIVPKRYKTAVQSPYSYPNPVYIIQMTVIQIHRGPPHTTKPTAWGGSTLIRADQIRTQVHRNHNVRPPENHPFPNGTLTSSRKWTVTNVSHHHHRHAPAPEARLQARRAQISQDVISTQTMPTPKTIATSIKQ